MLPGPRLHVRLVLAALAALLVAAPAHAFKLKWKSIDKGLLSETKGKVDPEASSEVVFWEIHVTDEDTDDPRRVRFETKHYIRIKVYDQRGCDIEGKVEIPYSQGESIDDLTARTIRTDGSVVELKKDAVFDRVTTRERGLTRRAKSFAMPDVQPGCVIEYQYACVRATEWLYGRWFAGQRQSPIRSLTLSLKPLVMDLWPYRMRIRAFNGTFPPPEVQGDRSELIQLHDIRTIPEEPYMPPRDQVIPWLYIDYVESNAPDVDEFWVREGQERYKRLHARMRVGERVRHTADSLTSGVDDADLRLEALHTFCRTRIRNVEDPSSGSSQDARERLLEDETRTPEKTLQSGLGDGMDVDLLFAALATAAGFETRLAALGDRSESFFQKERVMASDLNEYAVAVRVGEGWRFYDPAARYTPFGMLPWWEEGVSSLLLQPEKPVFLDTPISPPSSSCRRRSAHLHLTADGTLEGIVTETQTGHLASDSKLDLDGLSADARLEQVRRELLKQWGSVTLDSVRIEGVDQPTAPYSLAYRIQGTGYASPAGDRLLLQPAVFHCGRPAPFASSSREHWIYFHYPWLEEDDVWIELPEGYNVEDPASPPVYRAARTLKHDLTIESSGRMLHLYRSLEYGSDGAILIPPSEYTKLKSCFDTVQQRDDTALTLRRIAGTPQ